MSNDVIFFTQIASMVLFISSLFVLYRVLVQQKDATIDLLREKNLWLNDQLAIARESKPDVLLDSLEKRLQATQTELERLNTDSEKNAALILEKENERAELLEEIADLRERLDECPHCGAELVMKSEGIDGLEYENKSYACGYLTGEHNHPCPFDPNYPKLEEYDLETKYDERRETWYCYPKPKTKMAELLELDNKWGKTEDEAIRRVIAEYEFYARKVPRR